MIHSLKCEKQYFEAVASGKKTFEVRNNDRQFMVGDFLALNEVVDVPLYAEPGNYAEETETQYTGRCCLVEVVYILADPAGRFLQPDYVCMAIRPCNITTATEYLEFQHRRDMYEVPTYNTVTTKEETACK